jgi:hypothetical protein
LIRFKSSVLFRDYGFSRFCLLLGNSSSSPVEAKVVFQLSNLSIPLAYKLSDYWHRLGTLSNLLSCKLYILGFKPGWQFVDSAFSEVFQLHEEPVSGVTMVRTASTFECLRVSKYEVLAVFHIGRVVFKINVDINLHTGWTVDCCGLRINSFDSYDKIAIDIDRVFFDEGRSPRYDDTQESPECCIRLGRATD